MGRVQKQEACLGFSMINKSKNQTQRASRGRRHDLPKGKGASRRTEFAGVPLELDLKILTAKSALEGERKQVTVLFADLKGSLELVTDRDPEDARKLLDPVLG